MAAIAINNLEQFRMLSGIFFCEFTILLSFITVYYWHHLFIILIVAIPQEAAINDGRSE